MNDEMVGNKSVLDRGSSALTSSFAFPILAEMLR